MSWHVTAGTDLAKCCLGPKLQLIEACLRGMIMARRRNLAAGRSSEQASHMEDYETTKAIGKGKFATVYW